LAAGDVLAGVSSVGDGAVSSLDEPVAWLCDLLVVVGVWFDGVDVAGAAFAFDCWTGPPPCWCRTSSNESEESELEDGTLGDDPPEGTNVGNEALVAEVILIGGSG
jgi:hypothetical protein